MVAVIAMLLAPVGAAQESGPPLPPPRPNDLAVPSPEKPEPAQPDNAAPGAKAETDKAGSACIERLAGLRLRFESRPPVQEGECTIKEPVLVSSLPDDVAVSPPALMECPMAESLARWMRDVVKPETERQLQSAPTKLLIGTSYQCRDQRSGGKLSEHAFGNAADVMGFEFDKRGPLSIEARPEGSPEAAFQSAIRTGACPIFTTVLGPGSDAAHDDHLHLDMRGRRDGYRICQ